MNYYLKKYVGKYRVIAEIDQRTGDFCRDKSGNYCNNNDIYIKCFKGTRIWYIGNRVLQVYIPSIKRGNNILKKIDPKYVFDIEQTDEETLFKVKDKDIENIIEFLKPQTNGASISPFSTKNLKREKQPFVEVVNHTQNAVYEEIKAFLPKEDKLLIGQWNRCFIADFLTQKLEMNVDEIKADIKQKNMKQKDYFCHVGYWNEYVDFLKKEINNRYGCTALHD